MHHATTALLTELFDYAGLFPPAKLPMPQAVSNYADHTKLPASWMLGRFVLQATQLDAFEDAATGILPGSDDEPWRLSALVGTPDGEGPSLDEKIEAIFNFNAAHETGDAAGAVVCDAVEAKANTPGDVDAIMRIVPEQLSVAIEIDHRNDPRGMVAAIAGTGALAKIRCGGVTPDLIPSTVEVARFIAACAAGGVAFKATAGLHHPVRAEYPLSYEPNAPLGTMHGFLNVFSAAVMAHAHKLDADALLPILETTDPAAFIITEGGLSFRDIHAPNTAVTRARESFATGIGSCSFTEPLEDLVRLGVLQQQEA